MPSSSSAERTLLRQQLVRLHEVDHPDQSVLIELGRARCCEVQRDVRRVRPVEQASRETVVLPEREPIPVGVVRDGVLRGVLAERSHQLPFELAIAADPDEPAAQVGRSVRTAAISEARAEERELVVPRFVEEQFVQLQPALDSPFLHRLLLA